MSARTARIGDECITCDGLLGPLTVVDERRGYKHELCSKLQPSDWAALRPWFTGKMSNMSGA